jgi:predicted nucleic acid-binding protein
MGKGRHRCRHLAKKRAKQRPMIALDTNVFIYWLERNPEFYAKSADIIKKIYTKSDNACCSVLVLSEIYMGDKKHYEAIENLPGLTICDVTKEITELAGKLRHENGIRVIDSIHIATALQHKAKELITNDKQLLGLKISGLKIRSL